MKKLEFICIIRQQWNEGLILVQMLHCDSPPSFEQLWLTFRQQYLLNHMIFLGDVC
jgi:hypothetical protein